MSEVDEELQFESAQVSEDVDLAEVSAQISEIKEMLRLDPEFFIDFFIHEQLTDAIPEFHKEIWGLLTDTQKERILLAIPRGHNKTTLAKLAVVWHFLFTGHRFCVYLSNTNSIASNAAKDILNYFKSDNFTNTFGKITVTKSNETDSLWQFDLPMGGGRVKKCILRAVGADQQVRGLNIDNERPDLAVVDDVEDNKNTESELQQKKLDKWIFGPFLKALAKKRRKVIWLGNMLQKTSLLARLSRNPKWNPVVFGALVKNVVTGALSPLWPGLWTVEELREDFKEHKDLGLVESWMCEMMNMPGHGENGFTAEQINYQPVPTPDSIKAAWIAIDPAFGENAWNDNTSITVHVIPDEGVPMVAAQVTAKMDEVEMFNQAMNLAEYWGARVWGIESVAAQKVLISLFNMLLATRDLTGQFEFVPLMAGKGDPKVSRIRSWVSLMANKEYAIPEYDVEITNQLLNYNMKKTANDDDLIDSCAYGSAMMEIYLGIIIEMFNGGQLSDSSNATFGSEVSGA